jgi:hypothetical protein
LLHPSEVKLPHKFENNSTTVPDALKLVPIPESDTVVRGCTAVNLNQTSSSAVPPHEEAETNEFVAARTEPAILLQDVLDVRLIAPLHSSFATGDDSSYHVMVPRLVLSVPLAVCC